jgi:D-tyrosyl-tRNA(Tyr) deacylase
MRALLQRVLNASLSIDNKIYSKIDNGLLVLVGIEEADKEEDIQWLAKKIVNMRIFSDQEGKMNLSLIDINGDLLLVSQFTLYASTEKGNRPSFIKSARPDLAIPIYYKFIFELEQMLNHKIETGVFGADMKVQLINDGPVTIWLDSKRKE